MTHPDRKAAENLEAKGPLADMQDVKDFIDSLPPMEVPRALYQMPAEEGTNIVTKLPPDEAAKLIQELDEVQATELLRDVPAERAAAIVSEMDSDDQADLLRRLEPEQSAAILEAMQPEQAREASRLLQYPDDTAGGIMITEYLSYPDKATIGDVLDDLRCNAEEYTNYDVQYAYVVDPSGKLVGVLRLRDLLLSPTKESIATVMVDKPLSVRSSDSLPELRTFFDRQRLLGVPVVDAQGRLLGVVRSVDVEDAVAVQASQILLKFAGIFRGEELRNLPLRLRCTGRLAWLSINIVLNVIAASIIAVNEQTLMAAISLAAFLPIISDMSGCCGTQAIAVSMRELSLGLIKPSDVWRVFWQEAQVGVLNGLALGVLLGLVGFIWKHNIYLGLVVGSAMAINSVIAVCLGGTIPLLLKKLKADPALASAPLLTTVTDMCGFFAVLQLAKLVLDRLA